MMGWMLSLLSLLFAVFILITVHELGHLLIAKYFSVNIIRFSIGFGHPLIKWSSKTGTEYRIASIPLGGYVEMMDDRKLSQIPSYTGIAFNDLIYWKRILIMLAGPFANILFAVIILSLMYLIGVRVPLPILGSVEQSSIAAHAGLKPQQIIHQIDDRLIDDWQKATIAFFLRIGDTKPIKVDTHTLSSDTISTHYLDITQWKLDALNPSPFKGLGIQPYRFPQPPILKSVMANSPAEKSGLRPGDLITTVADKPITTFNELSNIIKPLALQTINITFQRNQHSLSTTLTVGENTHWLFGTAGYLGIVVKPIQWPDKLTIAQHYPLPTAMMHSLSQTYRLSEFILTMFGKILTGKLSIKSLGGPVALFQGTSIAAQQGFATFLGFIGYISIMIGIFNLLPIPGLDGSHIAYYLVEKITQRKISYRLELLLFRLSMIGLMILFAHALANDLARLSD